MIVSRRRVWFCQLIAATLLGSVGVLFYMLIDRDPPFVRTRGEIQPERPLPGQVVVVKWHVVGGRWCPGTLRRFVIDSHDVVWTIDPSPIAFGVAFPAAPDFTRRFHVPPGAWPGRAIYRVQTAYVCNPVHRWWPVVTTGPDVPFEIAESEK